MKALISYIRKHIEVKPESTIDWHFYQEFGKNESIVDLERYLEKFLPMYRKFIIFNMNF